MAAAMQGFYQWLDKTPGGDASTSRTQQQQQQQQTSGSDRGLTISSVAHDMPLVESDVMSFAVLSALYLGHGSWEPPAADPTVPNAQKIRDAGAFIDQLPFGEPPDAPAGKRGPVIRPREDFAREANEFDFAARGRPAKRDKPDPDTWKFDFLDKPGGSAPKPVPVPAPAPAPDVDEEWTRADDDEPPAVPDAANVDVDADSDAPVPMTAAEEEVADEEAA